MKSSLRLLQRAIHPDRLGLLSAERKKMNSDAFSVLGELLHDCTQHDFIPETIKLERRPTKISFYLNSRKSADSHTLVEHTLPFASLRAASETRSTFVSLDQAVESIGALLKKARVTFDFAIKKVTGPDNKTKECMPDDEQFSLQRALNLLSGLHNIRICKDLPNDKILGALGCIWESRNALFAMQQNSTRVYVVSEDNYFAGLGNVCILKVPFDSSDVC